MGGVAATSNWLNPGSYFANICSACHVFRCSMVVVYFRLLIYAIGVYCARNLPSLQLHLHLQFLKQLLLQALMESKFIYVKSIKPSLLVFCSWGWVVWGLGPPICALNIVCGFYQPICLFGNNYVFHFRIETPGCLSQLYISETSCPRANYHWSMYYL